MSTKRGSLARNNLQIWRVWLMTSAAMCVAAGLSLLAQTQGGQPPLPPPASGAPAAGAPQSLTPEQQTAMRRGGAIYRELCFTCHGADGKGMPLPGGAEGTLMGPALAGAPRVQGHQEYVIYVLLHGLIGPLDDKTYPSVMMPMGGNSDEWIAAVASFIRNGFGNTGSFIAPEDVAKARAATASRKTPWTLTELKAVLPVGGPGDVR